MKRVYKYQLEERKIQTTFLPEGYQILKGDMQHGTLCIWVLVDPDVPKKAVVLHIYGTGHDIINENLKYINTFFVDNGVFVFHLFEEIKNEN